MILIGALWLLPFLHAQVNLTKSLNGEWENQDAAAPGITEIVIGENEAGGLRVHAWGKCEPTDCDWGIAEMNSSNGIAQSIFDMGLVKTTVQFIFLLDSRLLALSKSEYRDSEAPPDRDHVEFFVRRKPDNDTESVQAKTLLNKVAETYRNLPAVRFQSENSVEFFRRDSDERRRTVSTIITSGSGQSRVETTGSGGPTVVIVGGDTVWTFFPESNEYMTMPAGKQAAPYARAPIIFRYTSLDQLRQPARIVGHGQVAGANCVMIAIGHDENHTRTLWIDSATNFVRKEESKDIASADADRSSRKAVTVFPIAERIANPNPELFLFDAAKVHAKLRSELQRKAPITSIGTIAPDFTLQRVNGQDTHLRDLRGKIVILDFWATWCAACREAMPTTELLWDTLRGVR